MNSRLHVWSWVLVLAVSGCGVGEGSAVGEDDPEGLTDVTGDATSTDEGLIGDALASDAFNRANSADLGANWESGYTNRGAFSIVDNKVKPTPGKLSVETFKGITAPNNQWAQVTLNTYAEASDYPGVVLRFANPPTVSGYDCRVSKTTQPRRARIGKWVDGRFTLLAINNTITWAGGDKIRCEAEGSALRLYQIRGTAERLVVSVSDTTFTTGRTGISPLVLPSPWKTSALAVSWLQTPRS